MLSQKDIELIPYLICRQILEEITEEEKVILNKWINENEKNKILYYRLMDTQLLEKEYHIYKSIDTERPMAYMQAKIKQQMHVFKTESNRMHFTKIAQMIAVFLLIVGCTVFFYYKIHCCPV